MLIATLSLTFTACSSDDDEPDNSEDAIDLADTRLEIQSWTGAATDVFNETVPFDVLEFHSNGTVTESNFKANTYITGTYTQSGNKVTFSGLSRWSTIWGSIFKFHYSYLTSDGTELISLIPTNNSLAVGLQCYVYRLNNGGSGNNGGNGGNGGNEGGGNNGGNGSAHHHECSACDGTGDCWNCYGSGTDPITRRKCNTCHGSGKCQICHGKGYIIV